MENKSELPMFKKSGDGLSRDVLKLKKLEAISEGWYKGQIVQLLDKVAKRKVINGVECFNTDIVIDGYTNETDTSDYAKNIKKLLELLGISKETLTKIYKTSLSDQVAGIRLNFNKNSLRNREFTEFDFKQTFASIKKQLENADKFELIHSNKYYPMLETERPAVASSDIYTGIVWKRDYDFFDELQEYEKICDEFPCVEIPIEIVRSFKIEQSAHYSEVKIYDEFGADVTVNYPELLINALKICLMFSGNKFAERTSIEKVSEEVYNSEALEEYVYVVTTKETYNNILDSDFLDEYDRYKKGSIPVEESVYNFEGNEESYKVNGILAMHYWSYYLIIDSLDNDSTNDLFYIDKKSYTFNGKTYYEEHSVTRYISVSGIKRTNAKIIASSFAQYADLQILKKKKKKRFLGIGGFIGSFLGGIFNLIMQGVQLIAKVLYYIPLVSSGIQFIAWIFSGKWSNDRDRFVMFASRIVLAIVALLIVIYTGGGGFQMALSLLASSYGMYTGIRGFDEAKEMAETYSRSNSNTEEDTNKLNEKLIDLSNSKNGIEAKNDALYKPFDEINNIYKSPFEKGGLYSQK